MVGSKEECELVATRLGLGDTTATTIGSSIGFPPGCINTDRSPPWLGWNPKAERVPCGADYDCLCIKG